jgi:hypothetical protein
VTKAPGETRGHFCSSKSKVNHTKDDPNPPHVEFFTRFKGTLPEVITQSDLEILNSALSFLFARLREARRRSYQTEGGRPAAFAALGVYWMFIALFQKPLAGSLQLPIIHLMDALVGLDNNLVLPIVKPIRRRGRSRSSHAYAALKGHAAGTVRHLKEAGFSVKEAHRAVAKRLNKLGVRPERGSGPITEHTVRNWCDDVSSDVGRHGTAARMHDFERQRFDAEPKETVSDLALSSLTKWVLLHLPALKKSI